VNSHDNSAARSAKESTSPRRVTGAMEDFRAMLLLTPTTPVNERKAFSAFFRWHSHSTSPLTGIPLQFGRHIFFKFFIFFHGISLSERVNNKI
jgi:hypothetical protein